MKLNNKIINLKYKSLFGIITVLFLSISAFLSPIKTFAVSATTSGLYCADNSYCDTGQTCDLNPSSPTYQTCLAKAFVPPPNTSPVANCDSTTNNSCACSGNSDCVNSQGGYSTKVCISGTCQSCTSSNQCSGGFSCVSGSCVTAGVLGASCNPSSSNGCQAGLTCDPSSGTCQLPTAPTITNPNTSPVSVPGGLSPTNNCPTGLYPVNGLCLPINQFSTGAASQKSLTGLLLVVIQFLLTFAGIVSVIVLIIGGFWYITSAGNDEQAEKGKKAIINAIIGLVVVVLAFAIVSIISGTLTTTNFLQ